MKKKTAHIISHTHWDREWYINSPFVNEWLPVFFDSLFAMMEKEPDYKFVLDGQTSMLDDCYVELEKQGRSVEEFKQKISRFAGEGRLILGPYYLQPDWQLVSDEALVRNMSFGIEMAKELNGGTSTGWLLDNFGQISQAPQIHKLFGMKGLVVWRGVEQEPEHLKSEFLWRSPDGTTMTTSYLLSSYRNAMRLADYREIIHDRIRNETEKIAPFSATGNVLLMNGYDQEMQPDNILPYIKDGQADFGDFHVRQSTPDEYMDAVLSAHGDLPVLEGALYSGRYISVFPGILSSRIYLKQRNDFCQRQLEQYVEPLYAICHHLGMEYPAEKIDQVWKKLLKNHPHDSICGVSVDDVHSDMEDRFTQVQRALGELIEDAVSKLCERADTRSFADADRVFTLFNTMLRARKETVFLPYEGPCAVRDSDGNSLDAQPVKGGVLVEVVVPALGICSVGIYPDEHLDGENPCESSLIVENPYIRVSINEDGSLNLFDKKQCRQYTNLGTLEDCADSGDEYNYSYLNNDRPFTTLGQKAHIEVTEKNALRTVIRVKREWNLPESLNKARDARSTVFRKLPVVTDITVERNSPVVKFKTSLRNTCKDHRLRVLFPTNLHAADSFAQTQFDVTRHPIAPRDFDNSTIPENVKRIIIGARESEPITQFPQREFAAVCGDGCGAAVFNKGLPEYEVLRKETTIAQTLFRCVGWLARTDLNSRIGDAGPEIFVPDAQCLRDMAFEYAFCPFAESEGVGTLVSEAQRYSSPVLVGTNTAHGGVFKAASFAELSGSRNLRITAVKKAQYSDDLQIRLYHAGDASEQVMFSFDKVPEKAALVNLLEEKTGNPVITYNAVSFEIHPKEIITMQVSFSADKETEINSYERHVICEEPQKREDFNAYPFPEIVSDVEAVKEELRAKALHRAYLEAKLSAIFTREKQVEHRYGTDSEKFISYKKELTKELQEIAYQLNLARIDKRVSEYLLDYYVQQEKDANP